MKEVLTTFGSQGYEFAKERLVASASGYFDEIICYGERDIDEGFYTAHSTTVSQGVGILCVETRISY